MLLVAGGQLDPNIGALLRRCLARKVEFRDLLVGPRLTPSLRIGLDGRLVLNGEELMPDACFLRHDVFLSQRSNAPEDHRAALNWYHAVRDWALGRTHVQLLNRLARSSDHGKYVALLRARDAGLRIPDTVVTNLLVTDEHVSHIRKPVAGGELTEPVETNDGRWAYPYFVQQRLRRPELRVYRIGRCLRAFELRSDDIDYRLNHRVEITPAPVPPALADGLVRLCDDLGLDFAAADFMLDANDAWTFLEVNSQPMFAAFDAKLDGALSDLLLDWLLDTQSEAAADKLVV